MRSKNWPDFVSVRSRHEVGIRTMCVSTDSDLVALLDVDFYHGGFLLHNLHDRYDDLVDVLPGDLLTVLEPLDHVLDEL